MTTTWVSGGEEWEVTTDCDHYDSEAACREAHDVAVEFWKGVAPPD